MQLTQKRWGKVHYDAKKKEVSNNFHHACCHESIWLKAFDAKTKLQHNSQQFVDDDEKKRSPKPDVIFFTLSIKLWGGEN